MNYQNSQSAGLTRNQHHGKSHYPINIKKTKTISNDKKTTERQIKTQIPCTQSLNYKRQAARKGIKIYKNMKYGPKNSERK